jgi:two-component system response regulator
MNTSLQAIGDTAPIVVVEDDPNDELLTKRALSRLNAPNPVFVLRDGQEAVDWLIARCDAAATENTDRPVFVLLDLKLPKLDGAEVLTRLRGNASTRHLPVVIFSSSDAADDVRRCLDAAANAYVQKPVDYPSYRDAVRVITEFWARLNRSH